MRTGFLFVLIACATPGAAPSLEKRGVTLPPSHLTESERRVHALNRLAFGPSATDLDRIDARGLDGWLSDQLGPGTDLAMEARLSGFTALPLSVGEAFKRYPRPEKALQAAGVEPESEAGKAELKRMRRENADELPRQILIELTQAKLLRAANSSRQLEEVLVDFWFNHFNVSAEKNRDRWMIAAYEREAIRPFVFGRFRDLLGATAKHPAMLWYLDNWSSVREGFVLPRGRGKAADDDEPRVLGLNENYARELLELHTVGVEAGYTQDDVREAAKVLTGWSFETRPRQERFGAFVFRPLAHDDAAHRVFGVELAAGGGQAQGERLLDFLARHPATARHLARKLCQRFVSDSPPSELVERIADVFLKSDGDLRETMRAIIEAPEFWDRAVVDTKTRTPFEFVIAAVRAVGSLDEAQRPLAAALEKMGQPLYRCGPPTGYRDDAAGWISAGGLVSRIDFGLKLAGGRIPGVTMRPLQAATIQEIARRILGRPASAKTVETLERALGQREPTDEAPPLDVAKVAGLLLGSPEFQHQ